MIRLALLLLGPQFIARLRAFWSWYRQDDTYNLTNRKCSSTVATALEAALEGTLGKRGALRGLPQRAR